TRSRRGRQMLPIQHVSMKRIRFQALQHGLWCGPSQTVQRRILSLMAHRGMRRLLVPISLLFFALARVASVSAQGIPANPAPTQAAATPTATPGTDTPGTDTPGTDTAAPSREALVWLAQLIQINTTTPPGNEGA